MPNATYCRQLIRDGVVGKGEADIAGPGVITAFLVSGFGTMAAILIAYIGGLVDGGLLRPVDRIILRRSSQVEQFPRIHVALRKAIIAMSDQQIITGIAVLAAGFQGLRKGTISVYHYQTVVYLAWMSSSVHLSALTLLRPFLWHHRGMMYWRAIGMLVLLVMLLIGLVPTLSDQWAVAVQDDDGTWVPVPNNGFGVPAVCFWGEIIGDGINIDAVLSYIILVISYVWKMGGLFMPVRNGWQNYFRAPLETLLERPLIVLAKRYKQRHGEFLSLCLFRIYAAFWLPGVAILEIMSSFSAALWLSVLGTVYGAIQILIPRQLVQEFDPSIADQESEFGFGQLVALILLVQPLSPIAEHVWLVGKDDERIYGAMDDTGYDGNHLPSNDALSSTLDHCSMLAIFASFPDPVWFREPSARTYLRIRLYKSRVFASLIWWTQFGILFVAAFIFVVDAIAIGWEQTANWLLIVLALAAFTAITFAVTLVFLPFSRLARSYDVSIELNTPIQQQHTVDTADSDQGLHLKDLGKGDYNACEIRSPISADHSFTEEYRRRRST